MKSAMLHLKPFKFLTQDTSHLDHCLRIFELIYMRNRQSALEYLFKLHQNGFDIQSIYQNIITPLLYEVGHLWEVNRFSVAEEHCFTANIQFMMSHLYSIIEPKSMNGYRMLATCVGDELHEVGLKMVSDIFEYQGWDVTYLGSNLPKNSFVSSVEEFQPHAICISITMDWHFSELKSWVLAAREVLKGPAKFIIGGLGCQYRLNELDKLNVILSHGDMSKLAALVTDIEDEFKHAKN